MQKSDYLGEIGLVIAYKEHPLAGQFSQYIHAFDLHPVEPNKAGKADQSDHQMYQPFSALPFTCLYIHDRTPTKSNVLRLEIERTKKGCPGGQPCIGMMFVEFIRQQVFHRPRHLPFSS
jgi:hypothetical protein